jgi:hypothetical protein
MSTSKKHYKEQHRVKEKPNKDARHPNGKVLPPGQSLVPYHL